MREYSARPLPGAQAKEITEGITLYGQADRALQGIDKAVQAFGGGAEGEKKLSSYFGLGQPQVRSLLSKVQMPDKDREAVVNAVQGIEDIRAAYRHALYGAALTESEQKNFEVLGGSPNNVDFIRRSRTFINSSKKKTRDTIKAINDQGYYVPKAIRAQMEGGDEAAPAKKSGFTIVEVN